MRRHALMPSGHFKIQTVFIDLFIFFEMFCLGMSVQEMICSELLPVFLKLASFDILIILKVYQIFNKKIKQLSYRKVSN